jgi:hypothetical protein
MFQKPRQKDKFSYLHTIVTSRETSFLVQQR